MKRFSKLGASLFGAIFTAIALGPIANADDTEIFFGQSQDAFKTNPNILFILDTSGSMDEFDDTDISRMDRMKIAMRALLQESSNYNVGVMGLSGSNSGGSVHHPVVDLEQDSSSMCIDGVCPIERISVKPEGGQNDAIENDDTGIVTLNGDSLVMAEVALDSTEEETVSDSSSGSAFAVAVVAESENSNGTENTRAITESSNWFYNGIAGSNADRYAYRFEDIDIPNGAVVTSASITFSQTSATAQTGNLSALVKVEAAANPDPLPTADNGYSPIAERLLTATRGVQWNNIAPDTTGGTAATSSTKSVTPDISRIVNLVVTLPDWKTGNAINVLLDPADEYTPSPNDVREMFGVDAIESLRPVLNYTYTTAVSTDLVTTVSTASTHLDEIVEQNSGVIANNQSNSDSRLFFATKSHHPRQVAFLFENLAIPNNAEIQSASLILTSSKNGDSESPIEEWEIVDTSSTVTTTTSTTGSTTLGSTTAPDTGAALPDPNTTFPSTTGGTGFSLFEKNRVNINIKAETSGTPLPYNSAPLLGRDFTTQFRSWKKIRFIPGKSMTSPNLSNVVSTVINSDNWEDGQSLSLMLSAPTSYNNIKRNSGLIHTALGDKKPQLQIVWKPGKNSNTALKNSQTTAIRYSSVNVPPRATVKSARLVFKSSKASIGPVSLEISAENNSNSAALSATSNNLSSRQRTARKVTWTPDPWELPETTYNSADFKEVVQEVIDNNEWCGGNPLTLFLAKNSGTDSRYAVSADANAVSAPTLELSYEPGSVDSDSYCSNANQVYTISRGEDDAVETAEPSIVVLGDPSLDSVRSASAPQFFGLRFRNLAIAKGADIVSATLKLTHEKDITRTQNYLFWGIKTMESPEFGPWDNLITHESRERYPTQVSATVPNGIAGEATFEIDVKPLLTQKINDPDWEHGNPFVIVARGLDNIAQSFYSFEGDETKAPQLTIQFESEREETGTLYRDNVISIVDSMVDDGGTPIVGAFYEAAQYFAGNNVDYGLRRGASQIWGDEFDRVSHPLSYTHGRVEREEGCTDDNLNAVECRTEEIVSIGNIPPAYISPINSECQQSHIIILSDGEPSGDNAEDRVKDFIGETTCAALGSEACGVELATWLQDTDIMPDMNGMQNITTHTIGFNLETPQFLEDLAEAGGGDYYAAASASELLDVFKNIFVNVSKTDTSFVAPSATVSQSNRLKNRDDIYFSLFKPKGTARWPGNLKRYQLGGTTGENADILDVNGELAVDELTSHFYPTAQSYWSKVVDGDSVLLGGAAEQIDTDGESHLSRGVYTYTGGSKLLSSDSGNDLLPTNENIDLRWLKLPSVLAQDDEYVENLLNWAHGKDTYDIDGDGNTDEARAQMGDPLHSQPLLVNYANGESVVHIATNEGLLHAIDHNTGAENFAFMPKELLANLRRLYEDQVTSKRPYGLDGGLTVWIDDQNNDGLVDPTVDKAYLYIGMRRGGNLYYALDISDPENPKYLWSIAGGKTTVDSEDTTADGNFIELGQTWSKPIKTKIYDNNAERDVLVFGAGYSPNQDPFDDVAPESSSSTSTTDPRQKRETDSIGRGFFVVDARTGERIWHADHAFYPKMKYSVPSELRVIDINFDGLADQIYFGDMGGQVWRFDYNNDQAINVNVDNRMSGGRIAHFASDTPETARRFYYPPDIALLNVDGEQQLSISIGSGWRAHPLDIDTQDRFYSFRMTRVYGAPTNSDGDIRYPEVTETTTGMIELSAELGLRETNKNEKGWFLPLNRGEKVLSSSVTVDGNLIFTTYIPSSETAGCEAEIGSGALYYLDLATGNAVKNLHTDDETEGGEPTLNTKDRRRSLIAAGIPPEASVLFPEQGKATVFVGREQLDEVQINTLRTRTFWQEHLEENL